MLFKKQTLKEFIVKKSIFYFLFLFTFIGFGIAIAQNLLILKDNQAQVNVKELKVYDNPPYLVKTGFLKWKWKFGNVIYVLKKGDRVEILERKMIGRYEWIKIKYKIKDTQREGIGWCFFGSKGKHSSFIPFIYAQTFSSSEEEMQGIDPEKEMQGIDLSSSALVCLCLTFIIPFFVFKFLPTNIEKYKLILSIFFDLVVLLVFGYVKSEHIFTIIKFWS